MTTTMPIAASIIAGAMDYAFGLDPGIWSKLPQDIIFNIIEVSDHSTQINWLRTRRQYYIHALPRVWSDLFIIWRDVVDREDETPEPTRLDYLAEKFACSDNPIKNKVRTIHVNYYREDPQSSPQDQVCPWHLMPSFYPLLSALPRLTCCVYQGALYQETLNAIATITTNLSTLEMRTNDCCTEEGRLIRYVHSQHVWTWEPWVEMRLDFNVLANLRGLQTLKIGRLQWAECVRLSEVVGTLRLRHLEISGCPWYACLDFEWFSSVTYFLQLLNDHQLDDFQKPWGCLPKTLETLILRNRYHWVVSYPICSFDRVFEQMLRKACQDCSRLRMI